MTKPNEFTPEEEEAIYTLGRKIEAARQRKHLSLREAAKRTQTMRGHMHEATWRRVERGFTQTKLGNIVYRPQAETLWAIAAVLGLDAEELCWSVGLAGPPTQADTGLSDAEYAGVYEAMQKEAPEEEVEAVLLKMREHMDELTANVNELLSHYRTPGQGTWTP